MLHHCSSEIHVTLARFFPKLRRLRVVTLAFFSIALLVGGSSAVASDNLVVQTLTEQARFWEGKGRSDLAATTWKRLLQIHPDNPDALAGLAQFEVDNNRLDAARALTDQLKRLPQGNSEAVKRIEGAASQKAINPQVLDQARAAAKAGRTDEAVGLYRQVLEGRALSGPLAIEYYQTLGGTTNGWEDARRGLEKLRADQPNNIAVGLAYAQHLTYRAATRREGIRMLADLSRQPSVAKVATEAWRRALIWLEAGRSDLALFQTYLKRQPSDAEVRSRVAAVNKRSEPTALDPRAVALSEGFSALNSEDLSAAEKRFEGLLAKTPKDSEALGGLGVVRLRQERFADAESLLASALRISGNKKWVEALSASQFSLAMQEGKENLDNEQLLLAKDAYERARKLAPLSLAPQVALIGVLTRLNQLDDAKALLNGIKDGPDRQETGRLLFNQIVANAVEDKRYAEAERLLKGQPEPLDAERRTLLAWAQYHQGKIAEATAGFADAYKMSPSKSAASGLVFSSQKQKDYKALAAVIQQDSGPLRELVSEAVQNEIVKGETRFEVDRDGRLLEVDPVLILNEDVMRPAVLAVLQDRNAKKAYDMLLPVEEKIVEIGDYGVLVMLGWAATEVGDEVTALRVLKRAAEESEDETFYLSWAQSLVKFGRDEEGEKILSKYQANLDADGLILLGWTLSRLGKYEQSAERFASSYAKNPSAGAAQGLVFSAQKAEKPQLILAAIEKSPGGPLDALVTADVRARIAEGEKKLGIFEDGRLVLLKADAAGASPEGLTLKLEPHLRGKAGLSGEGKLRQSGLIATLGWQGEAQSATLEVEHQSASDVVDSAKGGRWYAKWGLKMASNMELQLGVGRTITGSSFAPATIGEVGVGYSSLRAGAGVRVFRRATEESLLTLFGTPDINTGLNWGRVLETGVGLTAFHQGAGWNSLGSLVVARLEGQTVADNRKLQLYGLSLYQFESVPGLSLGPEVYFSRFNKNLRAFEPGHGGYFSPSRAITIGALARYEMTVDSMVLTLTGGLGWSYNRELSSAGNPITGARDGQYPAAVGRGLAYQGRIEGVQKLGPDWSLGFGLGMQRSSTFSDWRANVYAKRHWRQ